MYRGLLGDFFFIQHIVGEKRFKMLIDCGVLQLIGAREDKPNTALGAERIRRGVADLMKAVDGELDLVVVTHEHYDHLSGYVLAKEAFRSLKIGQLWTAWTEDRSDIFANRYRDRKRRAVAALAALAGNAALDADEMLTVRNLLQFHGDTSRADDGLGMARDHGDGLAGNASCETVIEWLKQRAGSDNVSYLKPGELHEWGVDGSLRAYVLGPPRDDNRLRDLNPSSGSGREVYLTRGEEVESVASLAAIHGLGASEVGLAAQPFSPLHRRKYVPHRDGQSETDEKTRIDPIVRLYERSDKTRQRIDTEWLGGVETLALKIDGDVNNTSLALALELPGKEILLFAADAQVGNWLSWGDRDYPADDGERTRISIDGLLSRVILYKVGHHASHNATLRERGLELMADPRLCVMIPVVEAVASEQKTRRAPKGWPMPYHDLHERLRELTKDRIIRGDGIVSDEKKAFKESIFDLGYGPNVEKDDPLWVELTLAQRAKAFASGEDASTRPRTPVRGRRAAGAPARARASGSNE